MSLQLDQEIFQNKEHIANNKELWKIKQKIFSAFKKQIDVFVWNRGMFK